VQALALLLALRRAANHPLPLRRLQVPAQARALRQQVPGL
jgi:hypothetical protein